MDPADKELLILRRPELVDNIDIGNGLLTHLMSRKLLNKRMVQSITFNNPPDKQVEELLDLLPKRGPNAFQLFCEALVASDQEEVVLNFLQRKETAESLSSSVSTTPSTSLSSASPLPVAETNPVPEPTPAVSEPASSAGSVAASSLSVPVQASLPPDVSLLTNPSLLPTTPQKRKPVKCSGESPEAENKLGLISPSEADCSPYKRNRTDSGSLICIRGENDKVIKIYSPRPKEKTEASWDKSPSRPGVGQASGIIPRLISQNASASPGSDVHQTDEVRYAMKHFIMAENGEGERGDENVRLATSMLSDLPQQYLSLLTGKVTSSPRKTREEVSSDFLRERLSRCDSADTMETRKQDTRLNVGNKPAEVDLSGQSVVRVMPPAPKAPVPSKSIDYTDGPLSVQVEECSRHFYNTYKDKSYRMVGMPRGQALIINVNEVSEKPPRRGTDIDRDNLINLLNQLHFQVTTYNDTDDLTALGMVEKLRQFASQAEHANADACVICLLSHGEEGYMFGTDGKKIPLEEIFLLFDNRHCPALLNKPKVFFIQACRGGMLDHGVKVRHDETDGGSPVHNNNIVQHPSMSDMLICYPTQQGYYAWRNRERGSWYIESVVKVFMKYSKCEDICAMLNRVNSDVSQKVSRTPQMEMDRMSQMSEYKSSLRKPYLFFYPGIGAPSVD